MYSVTDTIEKLDQETFEVTTLADVPLYLRSAGRCAAMEFNGFPGKKFKQHMPLLL